MFMGTAPTAKVVSVTNYGLVTLKWSKSMQFFDISLNDTFNASLTPGSDLSE